jgi:methylamine--corrinoid protein Co-methyltransferase
MSSENYETLLSTLDKAENGPVVDEKDWDGKIIGRTVRDLIEKYDIRVGADDPFVASDDDLADRVFAAGMEMAVETGVYCLDSHRQIKWTRDELEEILSRDPTEVTVGAEDDAVTVFTRRPEEGKRVAIYGGPFGIPVSEELFVPFHEAYAKEPVLDILNLGTQLSSHGRPIRAGSPWEAVAAWQEAQWALEILERAGRPGMAVGCVEIATTEIGELAGTTYGAYRPTDIHKVNFISEQKTAYHHLTKAAHYQHIGAFSEPYCNPIYGGYVGGANGLTVASVSGQILLKACYLGTFNNLGPTHMHLACSTYPAIVKATALAFQAIARNTNLITSPFVRPTAGPGVREIFYECAALVIAGVVSGVSYVDVVQSATGNREAHASPLEARFSGQIAHAVEGMSRKDADPIVQRLVAKYEHTQKDMMTGKPFDQVYDVETLTPAPEWQHMYEEVCAEMETEFGLDLEVGPQ